MNSLANTNLVRIYTTLLGAILTLALGACDPGASGDAAPVGPSPEAPSVEPSPGGESRAPEEAGSGDALAVERFLTFPLRSYTAYNVPISAVMDHIGGSDVLPNLSTLLGLERANAGIGIFFGD